MGKIYVSELAAALVEKHGLNKREAQQFIASLVDVVREGVTHDRQVKVKGLGTFKVVEVGARESVNVNTGERVTIDSHSKLAFTPDGTMKELVNKPFSQFETVVLNEGVTFDDMGEAPVEKPLREASEEEPQQEVPEEEPQQEAPEEEPLQEILIEEPASAIIEETAEDSLEVETKVETDAPRPSRRWLLWTPIVILLSGLCFGLGYLLGSSKKPITVILPSQPQAQIQQTDTDRQYMNIRQSPLDSVDMKKDSTVVEASPAPAPEQPKAETATPAKQDQIQEKQAKADAQAQEMKKYEDMDQRVRLGAYNIVGLDYVVTVKEGETLYRISRRALGPGMECYVEVYNGITKDTPIKVGQQIKIPKLRMKDFVRKKLKR